MPKNVTETTVNSTLAVVIGAAYHSIMPTTDAPVIGVRKLSLVLTPFFVPVASGSMISGASYNSRQILLDRLRPIVNTESYCNLKKSYREF